MKYYFVSTIYNKNGKRIGLSASIDVDYLKERLKNLTKDFGEGTTAKLWECKEIK